MKLEINRLLIENGQPKEIELFGEEFLLQPKMKPVFDFREAHAKKSDVIGSIAIKRDILDAFKQTSEDDFKAQSDVIRKLCPKLKERSIKKYVWAYRKKLNYDGRRPRKAHKRRPENAVTFSETYKTWLKQEDINKVKQGVSKFAYDYEPTFDALIKETGMSKCRLLATLQYLIKKGEINMSKAKNGKTKYQSTIRV